MPNQYNFRSDSINNTEPRFLASRIVKFPQEEILTEILPASFAFNPRDNIEIHFYTVPSNGLLLSTIITMSDLDILKSHIVSYADGTVKNYIRIDFTKLFETKQLVLIPGEYKLVMNYFSDEIGSYYNRKMYLQDVSESRTEVQLGFLDNINQIKVLQNDNILYEFVEKSFDKSTAVGVAEKIFKSGIELEDPDEGLIYENITDSIAVDEIGQTYDNTIARVNSLGSATATQFQTEIDKFLPKLYEIIREEIVIRSDSRIQKEEFQKLISDVLALEIPKLQALIDKRIIIS